MELAQWFLMGILFTLIVFGIAYWTMVVAMSWYAWVGMCVGAFLVLFGIGWAGASFLEGVAQSGAMGLILFCGPGILMMLLIWRYLGRGEASE